MSSNKNMPQLRFPGFTGEWEEKKMSDVFIRRTEKNTENNKNVLTISAEYGLVSQLDFFKKAVSASDVTGYYLMHKCDFAYNKSRSQGKPAGAIKSLKLYEKGVVSTLYICFRCKEPDAVKFWEQYFDAGIFDSEIMSIAQEGARNHGLLNVPTGDFFELTIKMPSLTEQQKIAECLSEMDNMIAEQGQKVEALKEKKRGMMQQMFPQKGETTPRLRFPEFSGEWEEKPLGEVFTFRNGYTPSKNNSQFWDGGTLPWFRLEDIRENGNILYDSIQHVSKKAIKGTGAFKANSIIVSTSATIGEHALIKVNHLANQRFVNLYPDEEYVKKIDIMYAFYYMFIIDNICKSNINIGTFASVNMTSFSQIPFPIPYNIKEQCKIAECLSAMDDLIASESAKLDALKEHKKGLMQQLFPQPSK